jgi:hypothetical protein
MYKLLYVFMAVLLIGMVSCNKDLPQPNPVENGQGEIQFNIIQSSFSNFKDGNDETPECSSLTWSYAKFELGGVTYTSPIITMPGGDLLTQVVKLDTGNYQLTSFYVYNDNGTPNDDTDDVLVRAAPKPNSEYWSLMKNKLNLEIHIDAFKKISFEVDVLCYEDVYYEAFGFTWLDINDVKIEKLCLFGDVCTGKLSDFEGSDYENQENGLQMDMPAIFLVELYKEGVLQRTFTNESWHGEGECLEIHWANDMDLVEHFSLVLKVLLPYGNDFSYREVDSISFTDDALGLITGNDNVLDFTVGNCNIDGADYVYPAWINVPDPSVEFTMTLQNQVGASQYGTYIGYDFSGIPAGFDVWDGGWPGWCGDSITHITTGVDYTAHFVNSLQPLPASFRWNQTQVSVLNWLINHLSDYFEGINLEDFTAYSAGYQPGDWRTIQNAIWGITNNASVMGLAQTMKSDANSNGVGYRPLPGEYAVIFIDVNNTVQLQIILVDP